MSQKKIRQPKKERVISKEVVAQVIANMEERGFVVVTQEQIDRQNKFIQSVSQGLNVADPENAGRQVAVVWQDHLVMLNDIAKGVMALGLVQSEVDPIVARGEVLSDELSQKLVKARTVIEKMANHLADKEKKAREVSQFLEVPEDAVVEKLTEEATDKAE